MKKHLESAGITRVKTDLDYKNKGFSEVTVTFAFAGADLDEAQRELVEVIGKAVQQHLKPPEANFDCYDKMLKGVKGFDWDKAFVSTEEGEDT